MDEVVVRIKKNKIITNTNSILVPNVIKCKSGIVKNTLILLFKYFSNIEIGNFNSFSIECINNIGDNIVNSDYTTIKFEPSIIIKIGYNSVLINYNNMLYSYVLSIYNYISSNFFIFRLYSLDYYFKLLLDSIIEYKIQ